MTVLPGSQLRVERDTTADLQLQVVDERETTLRFEASTSDAAVASVSAGTLGGFAVTATALGRATLTLSAVDDQGLTASRTVGVEVIDAAQLDTPGVVFETDFTLDAGYDRGTTQGFLTRLDDPAAVPTGWDAVRVAGESRIRVVDGEGIGGKPAMKMDFGNVSPAAVGLYKHLTGDWMTGYDELYVRYNVRFPNDFPVGSSGSSMAYWKWGRLWQNTQALGEPGGGSWTENREDSGYVVWTLAGGWPYTDWNITFPENTGAGLEYGSRSGPRQGLDWFVSGSDQNTQDGYFSSMADGAWAYDPETRLFDNRNQQYHTIEWRFRLATTPTSDDGIAEMWFDGVKQERWSRIRPGGGAPQRTGIPTTNRGSGYNYFSFFDNMAGWNELWEDAGYEGGIWVNDVVVSTTPIGHDYVARPPRTR